MKLRPALALALLTGCAVGPNYHRPAVETPSAWKSEWKIAEPRDTAPRGAWWEIFGDETLNALQAQAITSNQDLKAALARVAQARSVARVSASEFFPNVDLNATGVRSRSVPLGPSGGGGSSTPGGFVSKPFTQTIYRVPLDLSYEIDLWGRVRRAFESSRAEAKASVAAFESVRLILSADVARNYFQLGELDSEVAILEETVELRRDALQVVQRRFDSGIVSELDVARAKTELATAEADLIDVRRRRAEIENALAVLCGQPASNFKVDARPLALKPPSVPPGLPSDLLERRPDVAEAERSLVAANAQIGVAIAGFFPVVRMTGSAGYESLELDDLFKWDSRTWSLGPSISLPIFTGGRTLANVRNARARYDETVAQYRQQVLIAFRDVEDALVNLRMRAEHADALERVVTAARETAALSRLRYEQGLVNYLEVVDAERSRLQAERAAVQVLSDRLISTVLLVKAIGGGFDVAQPGTTR